MVQRVDDVLSRWIPTGPNARTIGLLAEQIAQVKFGVGEAIRVDRRPDPNGIFKDEKPFVGVIHTIQISIGDDHNEVRFWTDHDDWISEQDGHLVQRVIT